MASTSYPRAKSRDECLKLGARHGSMDNVAPATTQINSPQLRWYFWPTGYAHAIYKGQAVQLCMHWPHSSSLATTCSMCVYTHIQYEIIFCIGELRNGPSLPVVQELMALYPTINVRVFQGM